MDRGGRVTLSEGEDEDGIEPADGEVGRTREGGGKDEGMRGRSSDSEVEWKVKGGG